MRASGRRDFQSLRTDRGSGSTLPSTTWADGRLSGRGQGLRALIRDVRSTNENIARRLRDFTNWRRSIASVCRLPKAIKQPSYNVMAKSTLR